MKVIWRVFKVIILFHLITGVILAATAYYTLSVSPKKLFQKALERKPYDVIIVPGVPFESGKWSQIMEARVRWSVYLFEQGITKNIIYSGSAVYSPYIESEVMKLYAIGLGIPAEHIYTEKEAEHSTENLAYSHRIAKTQSFKKIALATDPFQSALLGFFDEDFEPPVDEIPIDFRLLKTIPHLEITITPDSTFVKDYTSIMERESLWERLKGTRGKKIKPEKP